MEEYEFLQQLRASVSAMFPRLSKLSALLLPALGAVQAVQNAQTCSDLMNTLKLDSSVKLILTSAYPDNSTFQDPYSQAYNAPAPYLPAFCRVYANISTSPTSATLFEVWMPLETWNGRFLTVGNGGGAGGVNYPSLGQGLRAGYATCSTDCGHNSTVIDGFWQALGEQVAIDFGWYVFLNMSGRCIYMLGAQCISVPYMRNRLLHSFMVRITAKHISLVARQVYCWYNAPLTRRRETINSLCGAIPRRLRWCSCGTS